MDTQSQGAQAQQHYDNPERPGWCAVCRAAYPCPGTATAEETQRLLARYGTR